MSLEIRAVRAEEADRFLELLCGVFGLDASQARHVFYNEPYYDLERKWALFENGEMVSILTTTPLEFGWGRAIGIAGVATRKQHQGRGLAATLLEHVLDSAERAGEGSALLFAHAVGLYQKVGFTVVDQVVKGRLEADEPAGQPHPLLTQSEVAERYHEWSNGHPSRLRRDDRRWRFWSYMMRECRPVDAGYVCVESYTCRESLGFAPRDRWPVPAGTHWVGLSSMARLLEVPLRNPKPELILMGLRLPSEPQMFLTDQF